MKMAGWLVAEGRPFEQDGQAMQMWRLRAWHPSMLPVLWKSLRARPAVVRPFVVLGAWALIIWRTRP